MKVVHFGVIVCLSVPCVTQKLLLRLPYFIWGSVLFARKYQHYNIKVGHDLRCPQRIPLSTS